MPEQNRLLICNTDGSQVDSIPVQDKPWNVTAVNNSTVAVTLLCRTIIRQERWYRQYRLTVILRLHGSGDRIFYSSYNNNLYWYSYTDNRHHTLTLPSPPRSMTTLQDNSLYVRWKSSKSIKGKKSEYVLKSNTPKPSLPILTAGNLPLIYINMSSVRLLIPKVQSSNKQEADSSLSGPDLLDQDILMACFQSMSVVPQADNPLPRHPTDKELYHRALHANLTHQPGSAIENRQYQIDVKGISMSTGSWEDFVDRVKHDGRLVNQPAVQIPALEWNTADKHFRKPKEDIELLPLVTGVDVKIVAAPAIVYQTPGVTDCSISKVCILSMI
ncbi:VPS13B [Mytilus edulis]|uniref:VPS13B n=1 Tax=Mytilus edulis TaxID=6550 RepID=A0A8S3VFT0_MYTED|nr:VPS13B [Mytilus edulis]